MQLDWKQEIYFYASNKIEAYERQIKNKPYILTMK